MKTISALPRVLTLSVLAGVVAYACTFLIKPVYQSEEVLFFPQAQVSSNPLSMLKQGGSEAGSVPLLNGVLVSPLVGAAAQTASGIVTSRTAIRDCVDKLSLDKAWGVSKNGAYERLNKWTEAKIDRNGMLTVIAKAESPHQAVAILETLQRYLDRRSQELTLNASRSNREYLEKRVASAEDQVNRIQEHLVNTMRSSPYANIADLMKGYMTAQLDLKKAEVAQASAESQIAVLEAETKRMVQGGNDFPSNLVALQGITGGLQTLTNEMQTRRIALADAMANFTKESPEYKNAVANVKNAERVSNDVLKVERQKVNTGLTPEMIKARSELSALKSATARYRQILDDYSQIALQAPRQFAAVERTKLEFQGAMRGYGELRQQLEIARLAESRDPSRFAIIDQPYPNPKPISPRRGLISALALVLTGLLQLALISLKASEDEPEDPNLNGHGRRQEIPRLETPEHVAVAERAKR